jgi:hypothetical protein
MRKRTGMIAAVVLVGALAVLAIGSYATADSGKKKVTADMLIGYQETPSVSTVASGNFEAEIDDAANEIHYTLSFSGLEGTVSQAHIHFGQRSVAGGISAWLCEGTIASPSASTPTCPQSGTVSGTITPVEVIGPASQGIVVNEAASFDELVAALRAGRAYANVHSSTFGPGEIRGQINDDNQRDD